MFVCDYDYDCCTFKFRKFNHSDSVIHNCFSSILSYFLDVASIKLADKKCDQNCEKIVPHNV